MTKAYRHQFLDTIDCSQQVSKIVCVGRNYAEHARELNNPVPSQPLLFIKPATAAVPLAPAFAIPTDQGACHHELEMAVLVGHTLTRATPAEANEAIVGLGLALDLTLREVQSQLKEKGQPWERAKAFDGACPLSAFFSAEGIDVQRQSFSLYRNDALQQSGNTGQMLFPVIDLMVEISRHFTLWPGDVVLTGTPAGVGLLQAGDRLSLALGDRLSVDTVVRAAY